MRRRILWIPALLALAIVALAVLRRSSPAPTSREKQVRLAPSLSPIEIPPTPAETARAAEGSQVRSLIQRLKESAVVGDAATRDAMVAGLRKWKGARPAVEQELASATDSRVAEALRRVLE